MLLGPLTSSAPIIIPSFLPHESGTHPHGVHVYDALRRKVQKAVCKQLWALFKSWQLRATIPLTILQQFLYLKVSSVETFHKRPGHKQHLIVSFAISLLLSRCGRQLFHGCYTSHDHRHEACTLGLTCSTQDIQCRSRHRNVECLNAAQKRGRRVPPF